MSTPIIRAGDATELRNIISSITNGSANHRTKSVYVNENLIVCLVYTIYFAHAWVRVFVLTLTLTNSTNFDIPSRNCVYAPLG